MAQGAAFRLNEAAEMHPVDRAIAYANVVDPPRKSFTVSDL
jgi:hypothetical protein